MHVRAYRHVCVHVHAHVCICDNLIQFLLGPGCIHKTDKFINTATFK